MSELDDVNDAALTAQGIREVNQRPTAKTAVDEFMLLLNAARDRTDDVLADRQQAVWKSPAREFRQDPDQRLRGRVEEGVVVCVGRGVCRRGRTMVGWRGAEIVCGRLRVRRRAPGRTHRPD